jgi:hypothetical protein
MNGTNPNDILINIFGMIIALCIGMIFLTSWKKRAEKKKKKD